MPRIKPIDVTEADPKAQDLLEAVERKIGFQPNIFRTFAHSPAVLDGYLGLGGAQANLRLTAAEQEAIALTVAGINGCDYCASAHTAGGRAAGVGSEELAANLTGRSSDERGQALLDLAAVLVEKRGWVSDADLAKARDDGLDDRDVVETVFVTAINIFTNYFNHAAGTEIDFPKVDSGHSAAA